MSCCSCPLCKKSYNQSMCPNCGVPMIMDEGEDVAFEQVSQDLKTDYSLDKESLRALADKFCREKKLGKYAEKR